MRKPLMRDTLLQTLFQTSVVARPHAQFTTSSSAGTSSYANACRMLLHKRIQIHALFDTRMHVLA